MIHAMTQLTSSITVHIQVARLDKLTQVLEDVLGAAKLHEFTPDVHVHIVERAATERGGGEDNADEETGKKVQLNRDLAAEESVLESDEAVSAPSSSRLRNSLTLEISRSLSIPHPATNRRAKPLHYVGPPLSTTHTMHAISQRKLSMLLLRRL